MAAQQLMTGRGYTATTVDDIIRLAGVAKGSFYHAFKSKEDLTLAALQDFEDHGSRVLAEGNYLQIEEPVERALAFVDFLRERSAELWAHGCLLGSIALEVAESYPNLLNLIDQLFERFENGLADVFAPALEARGVADVTAEQLSVHLLSVIEGSIIAARSHRKDHYLQDGITRFRHYLELLLRPGQRAGTQS